MATVTHIDTFLYLESEVRVLSRLNAPLEEGERKEWRPHRPRLIDAS